MKIEYRTESEINEDDVAADASDSQVCDYDAGSNQPCADCPKKITLRQPPLPADDNNNTKDAAR